MGAKRIAWGDRVRIKDLPHVVRAFVGQEALIVDTDHKAMRVQVAYSKVPTQEDWVPLHFVEVISKGHVWDITHGRVG